MRVWFKYCQRTAACASVVCQDPVLSPGQVIVREFSGRTMGSRTFHPDCFLRIFVAMVENTPFIPRQGGPGRPRFGFSDEERVLRQKLQAHLYHINQKRRRAVEAKDLGELRKLDELAVTVRTALANQLKLRSR